MLVLRPYVHSDWDAVLDICLLAFRPACEPLDRSPAKVSPAKVHPHWRTSIERYLRSLIRSGKSRRLVVAEIRGSVVGVVHYEVDAETHSGSIGVSAVHPARQGKGIGTLMYRHVLDAMRAQGVKYATADTEADATHSPARRAYEKLGFVAVPMVHYFKSLAAPVAAGTRRRDQTPRKRRRPAKP
jgi:ribosomal protein S18 acetylase RimI-like enzyme